MNPTAKLFGFREILNHSHGTNSVCCSNHLFVSVYGGEMAHEYYIISLYAFTGCRRCKAPGIQTYGVVLQMPGNEADVVPCELILLLY